MLLTISQGGHMDSMREAKYTAAIQTHRHCDTISMALVTGIIAVSGFSVSLYNTLSANCYVSYIFIAAATVNLMLYLMYRESSDNARIARNVARALESGDSEGISYVLYNLKYGNIAVKKKLADNFGSKRPPFFGTSIFRLVNYLAIVLILIMIIAFIVTR